MDEGIQEVTVRHKRSVCDDMRFLLVIVISIGITLLVYISFCEGPSPQCEGKEYFSRWDFLLRAPSS